MNVFKSFLALAVFSLLSSLIFAQPPGGPGERGPRGPHPEHLQETLDLSDEQMEALKPIFDDTRSELEALRDQEFESRKARRAAAQAIMEAQKEKMDGILTEGQMEKLDEMRPQWGPRSGPGKAGARSERANRQRNEALHQELKAYRETNVDPVLRKQRAQLAAELSAEDKATIAALREKRDGHRAQMKQAKEQGERPARPTEAQREAHKADRATIKALVEKYDSEIEALLAEVQPQAEQWQKDIKSIHEKYRPEDAPKGRQGRKNRVEPSGRPNEQGMRKANFLLMNPVG
jgi:cytochrome c556